MSTRRFASLVPRCCAGISNLSGGVLPLVADALHDASQPSTSAPAGKHTDTIQLDKGTQLNLFSWRHIHHDHATQPHREHGHGHDERHHRHQKPQGLRRPVTLEELEKACWSCDKRVKRGGLVCNGCETVQPPDESLDYFELFSLPSGNFDIDPAVLERRYKALQWNLHPDKMGHKPPAERQFSAQHASTVNLAYSILKSPLSRANYILALRGVSAGDNFEGTIDDPELLMEVLEAREQVEETDDPAVLSSLLARNRTQQEGVVAALSAALRRDDLPGAVGLTHQLQYLARLEQEIVDKMPQP